MCIFIVFIWIIGLAVIRFVLEKHTKKNLHLYAKNKEVTLQSTITWLTEYCYSVHCNDTISKRGHIVLFEVTNFLGVSHINTTTIIHNDKIAINNNITLFTRFFINFLVLHEFLPNFDSSLIDTRVIFKAINWIRKL